MINRTLSYSKLIVLLFFTTYLIVGLSVVKDYGISWDEPTERITSLWQYKFAVSKILSIFGQRSEKIGNLMINYQMLHGYPDRYYGTFLNWPLVALEHATGFTLDSREVFLSRHINTFLYFYIASICFYLLLFQRFKSRKIALLGTGILVLSPRIFAESFYNNKDMLFAAIYLIGIFFCQWFLAKISWRRAIVTGIILGIVINTRIMGLLLLGITIFWSLIEIISNKKDHKHKIIIHSVISIIAITVTTYISFIISMPTSWGNEFGFLLEFFKIFSFYPWQGKTLYLGSLVYWNNIPWHYIPVYLWATTPIWYSVLFFTGIIGFAKKIINFAKYSKSNFFSTVIWKKDIFWVMCFVLPIVVVVVSHAVIYNSWRHLYFIYGPFSYVATIGLVVFYRIKKPLILLTIGSMILTTSWMIKNHPYQFLYFNFLVRSNAAANFERDYWYVSSIDLLKYMFQYDKRKKIKIWKDDYLVRAINLMLNKEDKTRVKFVNEKLDADYQSQIYYNTKKSHFASPGFHKFKVIEVDGNKAMELLKRNDSDSQSTPIKLLHL